MRIERRVEPTETLGPIGTLPDLELVLRPDMNAITLTEGDQLVIVLNYPSDLKRLGFSAEISRMEFFENQVVNNIDTKNRNASVGVWTTGQSPLADHFSFAETELGVEITVTSVPEDLRIWYSLRATASFGNQSVSRDLDPELILMTRSGGG